MNMHQRFSNLALNAYIYRYYILGGAFSYFAVPETIRSLQRRRQIYAPWERKVLEAVRLEEQF